MGKRNKQHKDNLVTVVLPRRSFPEQPLSPVTKHVRPSSPLSPAHLEGVPLLQGIVLSMGGLRSPHALGLKCTCCQC